MLGHAKQPSKPTKVETPRRTYCSGLAYTYLLLCAKLHKYPSTRVSRRDAAAERPPQGVTIPRAGPTKQSRGQQLQGRFAPRLPPLPCLCPHLASHLRPRQPKAAGRTPGGQRTHPSMPSPEIAVVVCLSGPGRRVQRLLLLPGWLGGQSGAQKPRFSPCSCCG